MIRPSASPPPERRVRVRAALGALLGPLYALLRWAGRHAHGVYSAAGLFLVVGLGLALLALAGFALLAEGVLGGATHRLDAGTVGWMRAHRLPVLDALALAGAVLGSGTAVWVVLAAGTAYLAWSRHWLSLLLLWASLVGGRVLIHALKAWYGRPRPDLAGADLQVLGLSIPYPQSPSFPSGHALGAVVVYGTLAYLVARLEPTPRMRRWTLGAALALVVLIGWSRVYLGVHYPSDVIAGYMAGFIWATACAFAIEVVRYLGTRGRPAPVPERDLARGIEPLREAVEGEE